MCPESGAPLSPRPLTPSLSSAGTREHTSDLVSVSHQVNGVGTVRSQVCSQFMSHKSTDTQLFAALHTPAGGRINTRTGPKSHCVTGTDMHSHPATATCYAQHGLTHWVTPRLQSVSGVAAAGLTAPGPPEVPEEGGTAATVPAQCVGAAGALPTDQVTEAGFSPRWAPHRAGASGVTAAAWGQEGLDRG